MISSGKYIGILGLGSKSTIFYIEELNKQYNNLYGGYSTCPFKLLNTNFDKINNLLPNPSEPLDNIVSYYIDQLIGIDVNSIIIPNITLHETIDRIFHNKNIQIPLIHPIKTTIKKLKVNKIDSIVLIGSLYTMNSPHMNSIFETEKINILRPKKEDMLFIDRLRRDVYKGNETKELLKEYNKLIKKYAKNNSVVIACTELSVAYHGKSSNIYDMARIQINELLLSGV